MINYFRTLIKRIKSLWHTDECKWIKMEDLSLFKLESKYDKYKIFYSSASVDKEMYDLRRRQ